MILRLAAIGLSGCVVAVGAHSRHPAWVRNAAASQAAPPARSVWEGVYTEVQDKRGATVYADRCANCHGAALEGAEMAPELTGPGFTAMWNGVALGDLAERIRQTMPEDDPGSLSRQETADVVAHMLRVNGVPAGKTELPRETEALRQIVFAATKPDTQKKK